VQAQVGVKEGHAGGGGFELVTQNRDEYYEQTHLQTILFTISRQIVNQLTTSQRGATPKLNLQSRHQLFPQVLRIVEEFAERKIRWNGIDKRELGLEVYAQQVPDPHQSTQISA
jgi:type III restriction enzyme